jgi:hypothetical protein
MQLHCAKNVLAFFTITSSLLTSEECTQSRYALALISDHCMPLPRLSNCPESRVVTSSLLVVVLIIISDYHSWLIVIYADARK